ncbi:MAG TPA: hypothetical protein DDW81_02860, partial [Cryomorphaceae bacterium]|nr:hypothetical protein [Cryomorphaceae bacterium]
MSLIRPGNSYNEEFIPEDRGLGFLLKPFIFVMILWVIFWLDFRFDLELFHLGIYPKHWQGLQGVVFSPVIHGSLQHLTNNTIPMLVLGASLYYFYPRVANFIVIVSWVISGLIVWFIGRESYHIGASSLIYALAGFIFLSGILRKQANLLTLSLLVVFLYGSLVWGVLPIDEQISWEAHLAGAFSGFALAFHFRKVGPAIKKKRYSWEFEEEDE